MIQENKIYLQDSLVAHLLAENKNTLVPYESHERNHTFKASRKTIIFQTSKNKILNSICFNLLEKTASSQITDHIFQLAQTH